MLPQPKGLYFSLTHRLTFAAAIPIAIASWFWLMP
jgi:hypothetical protein